MYLLRDFFHQRLQERLRFDLILGNLLLALVALGMVVLQPTVGVFSAKATGLQATGPR